MEDDVLDLERFMASVAAAHDEDPAAWHRGMLEPPHLPQTASCEFCGVAWEAERRRLE